MIATSLSDKVESLQLKLLDAINIIQAQQQYIKQLTSECDRAVQKCEALRFACALERQRPDDLSRN